MAVLIRLVVILMLRRSTGLSHSNVRRSLMAPFYRGYEENVRLGRARTPGSSRAQF